MSLNPFHIKLEHIELLLLRVRLIPDPGQALGYGSHAYCPEEKGMQGQSQGDTHTPHTHPSLGATGETILDNYHSGPL